MQSLKVPNQTGYKLLRIMSVEEGAVHLCHMQEDLDEDQESVDLMEGLRKSVIAGSVLPYDSLIVIALDCSHADEPLGPPLVSIVHPHLLDFLLMGIRLPQEKEIGH